MHGIMLFKYPDDPEIIRELWEQKRIWIMTPGHVFKLEVE
jgi:hypothetical protein